MNAQLANILQLGDDRFDRGRTSIRDTLKHLVAPKEQILNEIEQETNLIRERFEHPTARLFPVAIMFLVLQKIIRP